MTRSNIVTPDSTLDLVLERVVDVPRELVWAAWTKPEHILKWFTPAPWKTVGCENQSPAGRPLSNRDAVARGTEFSERGVLPGGRAERAPRLYKRARSRLPPVEDHFAAGRPPVHRGDHAGTARKRHKYTAVAIHGREDVRKRHEAMGFHDGWGKALNQLVALVKTMKV